MRGFGSGVALLAAVACWSPSVEADDLTSIVQSSVRPLRRNPSTGADDAQVTVRNTGADPVTGPLRLVLAGGTPADLGLASPDGRTDDGFDYVEVPLTDGLLAPGASAALGVSLVAGGPTALRPRFRVDGIAMTPATSRRLTIVVDPSPIEGFPPPGSGFTVFVDGYRRGVTDATGRASLLVPVATTSADVHRAPTWKGLATLPEPRDTNPVTVHVALDEGAELYPEAALRVDEISQRILRRGTARITLRMSERGVPLRLKQSNLRVDLADSGGFAEITPLFRMDGDGSLSASAEAFHDVVGTRREPLTLSVSGQSVADRVDNDFTVETTFVVARERVVVQLRSPPSDPMLPIDGVLVVARLLGTDVRVAALTDRQGRAALPDLPSGNVAFEAERTVGGMVYHGSGSLALDEDSIVDLTLRGLSDVVAGVVPIVRRAGVDRSLPAP